MSRLNIFLFLLALGLWSSIYLLKFKEQIAEWYHNRFDKTPPPLPPEGGVPEVSLPFCYDPPAPVAEETPREEAHTAQETSPVPRADEPRSP